MSGNNDGREEVTEDFGIPPKAEAWTVGRVFGLAKAASERITTSVKDFDEKTQLSTKTKEAAASAGQSIRGFDEQHQVSTKTKATASAAGSSIRGFDEQHQVSTKTREGLMSSVKFVSERFGSGKGGSGAAGSDGQV